MARYRGPVCRLCRREGMKLYLKGERCHSEKCAIEKRNFVPGQHGKDRKAKLVGYGLQLREKQKTRRIYGVLETQFRNGFEKAALQKGITAAPLDTAQPESIEIFVPLPARVYANEGIAQILFLRTEAVCQTSYADKKGKYQDQKGLTLPFVVGSRPRP